MSNINPTDDSALKSELEKTLSNLRNTLLAKRVSSGHWEGHLSSSALSTATAVIALYQVDKTKHRELIDTGLDWLATNRNSDGGWGDTVKSLSNISTTVLCWAALALKPERHREAAQAAEVWLSEHCCGSTPEQIARAVLARYGKDRTFSIPILTACAITGRLGRPTKKAWRWVLPLPFELAALPHQWFKWLRLPVVSYALPALIALGQVRHHWKPTRNPISFVLRQLAQQRTLKVLEGIQPLSGGFLEATPLTSFVVMSLAHMNLRQHRVVKKGVEFLQKSVRSDGSWPIDTNLATWLTTLAVNALTTDDEFAMRWPIEERQRIQTWLLAQQYLEEHSFTRAAPGAWSWTDLPGGVPDADDTPGALLALDNLGLRNASVIIAAEKGIRWLLNLQNRDGGMPTFCRGWGYLPFDRSSPDITAHALLAFSVWQQALPRRLRGRVERVSARAMHYLLQSQKPDGSWHPLWFGNQHAPDDVNPTYGTSRVVLALSATKKTWSMTQSASATAVEWLLATQNRDGGWGGDKNTPSSIEETSLAVDALARILQSDHLVHNGKCQSWSPADLCTAVKSGVVWLVEHTKRGTILAPSPIGFYFAKLWYFEELYPLVFAVSALSHARTCHSLFSSQKTAMTTQTTAGQTSR